jgi:hypothetical protein
MPDGQAALSALKEALTLWLETGLSRPDPFGRVKVL